MEDTSMHNDLMIKIFEKLCKIESKLEADEKEDEAEDTLYNPMTFSNMLEGEY